MGASLVQIIRLLMWQFSKPIMWASAIALPLAYLASNFYLDFFADRLPMPGLFIAIAGVAGLFLSWAIVSVHAMKIANTNPIHALRYE